MSDIPERLIRIRKRIAMTEQRIAAQRARVHRWQAKGNHLLADRASVLLTVMETTAERLRALRATLEACELQLKLGARWSAAVGVEALSSSPTTVRCLQAKTLTCPRCGLIATCMNDGGCHTIEYDSADWARRCQHQQFDGLAFCLMLSSAKSDTVH